MPSRRKLLVLAALTVAVPILAVVGFVYRYDMTGWVRGEAKYKSQYTGAWKAEIERWHVVGSDTRWQLIGGSFKTTRVRIWEARLAPVKPSLLDRFLDCLGVRRYTPPADKRLLGGDSEAIPVLLELLQDDDPQVRLVACEGLIEVGPNANSAVPALNAALTDNDHEVRRAARGAIETIESRAP